MNLDNALYSTRPCQMCTAESKGSRRTLMVLIGPNLDIFVCPVCDQRP